MSSTDTAEILRGWKEIAQALGVAERTAKDYPVRTVRPLEVDHDQSGKVMITRRALDAWRAAEVVSHADWMAAERVPYARGISARRSRRSRPAA